VVTAAASSRTRGAEDRDFLLRSLLDLERERAAGDLADDDYHDLKTRYEAKLADLTDAPASVQPPDTAGAPTETRRVVRVVATVAVIAIIGIGGGLAVAAGSGSREPGQNLSGRQITTSAQQLARAATLAGEGDVLEALKVYDEVLAENPEDVTALTYKGWLLRNVGTANDEPDLAERGVALIEQATQIDPRYAEAWFFRGIIFLRDEDAPEKAVDALKLALANDPIPEVEAAARELLAEIAQST
jgi:tetratricopeptide (TPR) repeat protein